MEYCDRLTVKANQVVPLITGIAVAVAAILVDMESRLDNHLKEGHQWLECGKSIKAVFRKS